MEDEDNENGLVDSLGSWEEGHHQRGSVKKLSPQMTDSNICIEEVENEKKNDLHFAHDDKSDGNETPCTNMKNAIKELKKSINETNTQSNSFNDVSTQKKNQVILSNDTTEEKAGETAEIETENITEYTEYLGLQPALTIPHGSRNNCLENDHHIVCTQNQSESLNTIKSPKDSISNSELPLSSNLELSKFESIPTNNSELSTTNSLDLPLLCTSETPTVHHPELLSTSSSKSTFVPSQELLSAESPESQSNTLESTPDKSPVSVSATELPPPTSPELLPARSPESPSSPLKLLPAESPESSPSTLELPSAVNSESPPASPELLIASNSDSSPNNDSESPVTHLPEPASCINSEESSVKIDEPAVSSTSQVECDSKKLSSNDHELLKISISETGITSEIKQISRDDLKQPSTASFDIVPGTVVLKRESVSNIEPSAVSSELLCDTNVAHHLIRDDCEQQSDVECETPVTTKMREDASINSSKQSYIKSSEMLPMTGHAKEFPINDFEEQSVTNLDNLPTTSVMDPPEVDIKQCCTTDSKVLLTSNVLKQSSVDEFEQLPNASSSRSPSEQLFTSSQVQPETQTLSSKNTTRVYMCAACETSFENWNLFLHMRDVHKRYICLFCLGMFAQAERLSDHLTRTHSAPEMAFNSVDEFYHAFQGSCYIVCCSCEKMFLETDDFSNHYCPPKEDQSTFGACSECNHVGIHAITCNLASEKIDKASSSKAYNISSFAPSQTITGVRRHSQRTIKPNYLNDDYLYTNLTKRRIKSFSTSDVEKVSDHQKNPVPVERMQINQESFHSSYDETIMEVSKSVEDSNYCHMNDYAQNPMRGNNCYGHVSENQSLNDYSTTKISDSVSDTLMKASDYRSKFIDPSNTSKLIDNNYSMNEVPVESSDPKDEDDVRLSNKSKTGKDFSIENNFCNNTYDDSNLNLEPQTSDSPSSSASRDHDSDEMEVEDEEDYPESRNKPILSATPVSDRSLVIKICTKNNSMFSISASSALQINNTETHDTSRESEENNNSELSDNKASVPEENKKFRNELNLNQQDSDSGSNKLDVDGDSADESVIDSLKQSNIDTMNETVVNLDDVQVESKEREGQALSYDDEEKNKSNEKIENNDGILMAGDEIPLVDLNVDHLIESMEIKDLLKRCVQAVCAVCVYCNHARHIAVNGKQLGLHMLAEHRFQPQHPAIVIQQEQFIIKVKKSLPDLESYYFNLDSYNSEDGTYNISPLRTYECFHCRFVSSAHKELYLHNRKMHQKPILICIMCKCTFYNYSELLCHLCPGVYADNMDIQYRCCLCTLSNLPSAFRLMVHLRKKHHACDVCLETTENQQRLSNHVWKHKLHHFCYRCGIAYRNKPDITKHLFWKHGTESILCKKCLQKKWPHIYHFCIPPPAFACEECGFTFSKAVALKVHKRTHTGDSPYSCSECPEKLISKKLLAKHEQSHREPPPLPPPPLLSTQTTSSEANDDKTSNEDVHVDVCDTEPKDDPIKNLDAENIPKETVKKVIDVYDLPPLNLSDDSDSEDEIEKSNETKSDEKSGEIEAKSNDQTETSTIDSQIITGPDCDTIVVVERNEEEKKQEEQIMDGIWDNFKSYTASLEKHDTDNKSSSKDDDIENSKSMDEQPSECYDLETLRKLISAEHDYWIVYSDKNEGLSPGKTSPKTDESNNVVGIKENLDKKQERTPSPDLRKTETAENETPKKKVKTPKKKKQNSNSSSSDSSSDSDSSNCSCGTNCSCSSSSSSSSSSSDSSSSDSDSSVSENSPAKTKRKKEKDTVKQEEKIEVVQDEVQEVTEQDNCEVDQIETVNVVAPLQLVIVESDLDTTESETDEDFYDENPQKIANNLIAEKRKLLLAAAAPDSVDSSSAAPVNNGIIDTDARIHSHAPSPIPIEQPEIIPVKKKNKGRKRKKTARGRGRESAKNVESIKLNIPKSAYQKKGRVSRTSNSRKRPTNTIPNQSLFETNHMMFTESQSSIGTAPSVGGSGSETDGKRSSKRKRVPKKFYGDSSDEENHRQLMLKWRRVETPLAKNQGPSTSRASNYAPSYQQQQHQLYTQQQQQQQLLLQQQQQQQQFYLQQQQQILMQQQQQQQLQEQLLQQQRLQQQQQQQQDVGNANDDDDDDDDDKELVIAASGSDSNDSSSDSDSDNEMKAKLENPIHPNIHYPQLHPPNRERANNLYCYCQCPYDEVSEMIACDGDDCKIEWFHFECVGIMVPPKGKWYCPDCRRKLGIPDDDEEDFTGSGNKTTSMME